MNQNTSTLNTAEYDDEFLEWEERDDSIPYLNHCIGNFYFKSVYLFNIIAGSIAGITEHVTMLPFDTVKVTLIPKDIMLILS